MEILDVVDETGAPTGETVERAEAHRGTRNDSRNIPYVIAKIAEIKGVSVEEVEQTTRENAFALFTKVPR